jgi:hypothetical protein
MLQVDVQIRGTIEQLMRNVKPGYQSVPAPTRFPLYSLSISCLYSAVRIAPT